MLITADNHMHHNTSFKGINILAQEMKRKRDRERKGIINF